jgi:hypothetical protein
MGKKRGVYMGDSFYDRLPLEMVAGFFYQIHKNIDKGILSDVMHHEIKLLKRTAKRKRLDDQSAKHRFNRWTGLYAPCTTS